MDFSLQQNKKYIECGDPSPGRDPRLKYIASGSVRFIGNGFSTISVDTNKIGNFENDGAEYRSKSMPRLVNDHDFCDKKALTYEIYDVGRDEGSSTLG